MTPLIDVVFLLLTFFIFSLALMVRVDLFDVSLPSLQSGVAATESPAVTVTLTRDGAALVNGEETPIEDAPRRVLDISGENDPRVVIAADERGATGDLLRLIDALAQAGVTDFSLAGAARDEEPPGPISGP